VRSLGRAFDCGKNAAGSSSLLGMKGFQELSGCFIKYALFGSIRISQQPNFVFLLGSLHSFAAYGKTLISRYTDPHGNRHTEGG
jgi:hypothetical protein